MGARSSIADELDPKRTVRDGYDRASYAYRPDEPGEEVVGRYEGWLSRLRSDFTSPHAGSFGPGFPCPSNGMKSFLSQRVPAGGRVLDLGCGCGLPAARLLSQTYSVTGVDFSPVQVARARRNVPGGRFVLGDMTSVAFAPASFAAVVCFYAIIHVPVGEQPALLRKVAGWLAPGGVFLATVGKDAWTGVEQDWLGVEGGTMYWSHEGEAAYRRWLGDAGLDVLWSEVVPEGAGGHVLLLAGKRAERREPGERRA